METQFIREVDVIEKKKHHFERYKKNTECIFRLEEKLDLLVNRIESVKSPNYSGMPRGGTPVTIADLLADKEDLTERINKLKLKNRTLKKEITREIDTLEDHRYSEILEARYIDGLTIEEVAAEIGYTERHVYNLQQEAFVLLADREQVANIT